MPKSKARAIYAIYAFCRKADDSIDEASSIEEQEKALQQLKEQLDQFSEGNIPDDPIWRALEDVFHTYEMSLQPFYDQLQGQTMDFNFIQPETLEDLERYSYYVAGSVGLMLLPILATDRHHELHESAISLGVAMQITNILRDVGEDQREIGRIYLPSELMAASGYSEQDLQQETVNTSFIELWERLAARSEMLYSLFKKDLRKFDEDSQFPVLLSANIYQEILDVVRSNQYDSFTIRNKTTLVRKLCLYRKTKKQLKR